MQTDASSLTYAIPFFISVISYIKILHHKKRLSCINKDHIYIEKKLDNLEEVINKHKSQIFNINNQIDYIYEALVNTKTHIKQITLRLENTTKFDKNNNNNTFLETIINQKFNQLEKRIKEIENRSLSITENIDLKIINPDFLIKDNMYSSYKQCQSPYNLIYTSSSTNVSSTFSPSKNNEWISLT